MKTYCVLESDYLRREMKLITTDLDFAVNTSNELIHNLQYMGCVDVLCYELDHYYCGGCDDNPTLILEVIKNENGLLKSIDKVDKYRKEMINNE